MDLTARFRAAVRAIVGLPVEEDAPPRFDRLAEYRAQVMSATADGQHVDLQPENKRIAGEKNVPVRVGVPGLIALVQPGAIVMLGWEGGDPSRPYCKPTWEAGATVIKLILSANLIQLGGNTAMDGLVLGTTFRLAEDNMLQLLGQQLTLMGGDPVFAALCSTAAAAATQRRRRGDRLLRGVVDQ